MELLRAELRRGGSEDDKTIKSIREEIYAYELGWSKKLNKPAPPSFEELEKLKNNKSSSSSDEKKE